MISHADPSTVELIVEALNRDQVVAIPTDTVYGLAANPRSEMAVRRLFELKQRPEGVPVAVLASTGEQAASLVRPSEIFDAFAQRYWPGALTIVAAAEQQTNLVIASRGEIPTIGVRVPDHDLVRRCAEAFGPIAATSANRHGSPPIVDPGELAETFGEHLNVVVDGGRLEGLASTVVDVSGTVVQVLRQGVVQVDYDN